MKKFLAALLTLVMVLSLAACGGKDSGSTDTPPADSGNTETEAPLADSGSGEKIDVNVVAAEYGQNTKTWWADFEKAFNESHDDINLVVEVVSWNDISTVVNTRISGNAAPVRGGRHRVGHSRSGLRPRHVLQQGHPGGRRRGSPHDLG